jgi:hypothetical protein
MRLLRMTAWCTTPNTTLDKFTLLIAHVLGNHALAAEADPLHEFIAM